MVDGFMENQSVGQWRPVDGSVVSGSVLIWLVEDLSLDQWLVGGGW